MINELSPNYRGKAASKAYQDYKSSDDDETLRKKKLDQFYKFTEIPKEYYKKAENIAKEIQSAYNDSKSSIDVKFIGEKLIKFELDRDVRTGTISFTLKKKKYIDSNTEQFDWATIFYSIITPDGKIKNNYVSQSFSDDLTKADFEFIKEISFSPINRKIIRFLQELKKEVFDYKLNENKKIMKKVITLTENDLNKIIKKIIKEQPLTLPPRDLSPNVGQGEFTPYAVKDRGDVSNDINFSREIKLGKNLFKLGSSEVNTNSNEFRRAIELFSKQNISNAVITPGVSGVSYRGESSDGPRNIALGQNRAKSFINALKNSGITNVNFQIDSTVVGTNTIPNSEGANAEQFVIVKYSQNTTDVVPIPPIDNTATLKKPYITDSEFIPIPIGKDSVKICLQITVYKTSYYKLLQQIQMIKRFGTVKNIKCP